MKLKMKKVLIFTLLMIWAICGCGKKDEAATVSKSPKVRLIDVDDIIIQEEKEFLISIDPGHQGWDVDMSAMEPNAPGSSVMKMKATSGTAGRFSSIPEFQLNLDISLMLRDALVDKGYEFLADSPTNQLFPIVTNEKYVQIKDKVACSYWSPLDEERCVLRFVTDFATSDEDVKALLELM